VPRLFENSRRPRHVSSGHILAVLEKVVAIAHCAHTSSCDLYPLAVLRRPLRLLSAVLRELNGEIASGEVEFELGDNTQPKLPHSLEFCVAFRPHASIIRRTRYHTDGGIESSRQQAWVKHWRVQLATTAESQRGPKARTSFCGLESRQRSL
jgi:hypothetical protein